MKKAIFYTILTFFGIFESCKSSGEKPEIGDAAFYQYIVREGNNVVYNARQADNDTAMVLVEKASDKADRQNALMRHIAQLSVNDSVTFDLPNGQRGFLRLYRLVKAKDFPTFIAESEKKRQLFEQNLQEIKKEVIATLPYYQKRQKIVQDSTILLAKQYNTGQLKEQLKRLPSGVEYLVIKGKGVLQTPHQKWVWFHYCGALTNGTIIATSFGRMPSVTNLAEFNLLKHLEISVATFDEGDTVLLVIPPHLGHGEQAVGNVPPNSYLIFWIEVIKSAPL